MALPGKGKVLYPEEVNWLSLTKTGASNAHSSKPKKAVSY